MYRLITYRSRKLKHTTLPLYEEDEETTLSGYQPDRASLDEDELPDEAVKLTRKERRAQKKQLKTARKEAVKTYIIDGEEVDEDDLTEEEWAEIRASEMINTDSFYDALEPVDSGEAVQVKRKLSKQMVLVIGMVIICIGIGVVMIIGVTSFGF